ncbi:MAG: ABC transporter ATP-binding protein [Bauldia sp.]|nr:ABC transporter ATP-binding protein [Bauldia sp.]
MLNWFERLIDPFAEAPVEQPPAGLWAFFRYFLAPVKGLLVAVLVSALVVSIVEMALLVFLGDIVDRAARSAPETFIADNWLILTLMSVVILVIRPVASLINSGLTRLTMIPGLTNIVRWRTYRYVLRQSLSFFTNDFAGRIAQKIQQTGQALRETVFGVIEGLWTLLIYMVGTIWLFADLSPWLILPILVWSVAYGLTTWWLVPPVRERSQALAEANSAMSGRVVDSYTNIQSVKLFAHPEREDAFVLESFRRTFAAAIQLNRTITVMTLSLTLLNGFLIFAVGALSVWLWTTGEITLGGIALANALVLRLNQMSGWIMRTITGLFESVGTVQNGIQTISRPRTVVDLPDAKPLVVGKAEIRFENISFNYGKAGEPVIDGLSLVIKPGEKVGLVGRSGAGKSTLANLLLRFYDLDSGRILIDGQDIAAVTQESLRAAIGVVTQDTSLLHRSVRDNIRYGRPESTEEEIVSAAERAQAHDFIVGLKDFNGRTGYDAHVGERGIKLSGGQRQRVAIARLLLKNAPILMLDEATSALDSEVEAAIQEQLYSLMEGKTVIAIAHRLSTIAILDRLVIMDEGKIIGSGTHEELLRQGGVYAALWHRQSGGFLGLEPSASENEGARPVALAG